MSTRLDDRMIEPDWLVQAEVTDAHGGRLAPGSHPPGPSSRLEVADMGPSWTFETYYGRRQVDRQTFDRDTLARQGWTVTVPATVAADLERAGFQ
jgi:hypothetical protein